MPALYFAFKWVIFISHPFKIFNIFKILNIFEYIQYL